MRREQAYRSPYACEMQKLYRGKAKLPGRSKEQEEGSDGPYIGKGDVH